MTRAEDIHHTINDADDLEEVWQKEIPVADVFRNLMRRPGQLVTRWNWKSAFLGAVVRASFYFTVYKASRESWLVTITAVLVELSFRFFTTGVAGAIVQSFRHATPPWLATVIISISLPTVAHLIEFFTHYIQETLDFGAVGMGAAACPDAWARRCEANPACQACNPIIGEFMAAHARLFHCYKFILPA